MEPYSPIYAAILINEAFDSFEMKEGDTMEKLSRVNVLIGKNNSGKSRFMRGVFGIKDMIFIGEKDGSLAMERSLSQLSQAINDSRAEAAAQRYRAFTGLSRLDNLYKDGAWKDPSNFELARNVIWDFKRDFAQYAQNAQNNSAVALAFKHLEPLFQEFERGADLKNISQKLAKFYIPVLRGLRPSQIVPGKSDLGESGFDSKSDNFKSRTYFDYFHDKEEFLVEHATIITGLHLYEESHRLLLGSLTERRKFREFEEFIGSTFFPGQEFSITPRHGEDVVHVRIGDKPEDEKPIHQLGDGIQAIIILTYPLFFHQGEHAVICYEEPETHLHPGLQRLFMETLLREEFSTFQYFITTHSNHFLDMTADYPDISVYTFSRKPDAEKEIFQIENVENECQNVLQLIGARASSVFLSNCTIWVEGITDRLYLRHYLRLYQESLATGEKRFREDYHYSFVEYGGGNIVHWSFLDEEDEDKPTIDVKRLCSKLFLVTDSDGISLANAIAKPKEKRSAKEERIIKLSERLGEEQYHLLECREIENLLSREVLKKTIESRATKGRTVEFKPSFDKKDYRNIYLGTFISDNTIEPGRPYKRGTLADKPGFCQEAIRYLKTFTDLSEEAQKLTKKLYGFIAKENR